MRRRVAQEHGTDNPWTIKHVRGGLVDVEFLCQYLQLRHAADHPSVLCATTAEAYRRLGAAGIIPSAVAGELAAASTFLHNIQGFPQADRGAHLRRGVRLRGAARGRSPAPAAPMTSTPCVRGSWRCSRPFTAGSGTISRSPRQSAAQAGSIADPCPETRRRERGCSVPPAARRTSSWSRNRSRAANIRSSKSRRAADRLCSRKCSITGRTSWIKSARTRDAAACTNAVQVSQPVLST